MSQSAEYIQEKMLANFSAAMKRFYVDEEESYLKDFKQKIKTGEIDTDDYNNKKDVQREVDLFLKDQPERIKTFIKNYVQETNDNIFDALKEDYITQEEAELSFKVLKHLLIAAEIHVDSSK